MRALKSPLARDIDAARFRRIRSIFAFTSTAEREFLDKGSSRQFEKSWNPFTAGVVFTRVDPVTEQANPQLVVQFR